MKLADLTPPAVRERLAGAGLKLHTGPFLISITSRIPAVEEGLRLLYADYEIRDDAAFADFHVAVSPPPGVRRWLRPQVLFHFDGVPPFKPLPLGHAYPMLEWGLNWCVSSHCHQYVIAHAAVIERNGCAMILPAPPGSGKSTLCAGLVSRGWRLLSDELALIDPRRAQLVPLPRPISLKNVSIDLIRAFAPDAVISRPTTDTTKGTVAHMRAPRASVSRAGQPAAPGWLVFPRFESGAAARLHPHPKARALLRLADNAFNYSLHGRSGFDTLAKVVDASACFEFVYGDLDEASELFARLPLPEPA